MSKYVLAALAASALALLSGCTSTLAPTYTSTNADLLRIGSEQPSDAEPVVENLGTFCLEVSDRWKQDGETPDGQPVWSKDTFRKAVPCR